MATPHPTVRNLGGIAGDGAAVAHAMREMQAARVTMLQTQTRHGAQEAVNTAEKALATARRHKADPGKLRTMEAELRGLKGEAAKRSAERDVDKLRRAAEARQNGNAVLATILTRQALSLSNKAERFPLVENGTDYYSQMRSTSVIEMFIGADGEPTTGLPHVHVIHSQDENKIIFAVSDANHQKIADDLSLPLDASGNDVNDMVSLMINAISQV